MIKNYIKIQGHRIFLQTVENKKKVKCFWSSLSVPLHSDNCFFLPKTRMSCPHRLKRQPGNGNKDSYSDQSMMSDAIDSRFINVFLLKIIVPMRILSI